MLFNDLSPRTDEGMDWRYVLGQDVEETEPQAQSQAMDPQMMAILAQMMQGE